MKKQSEFLKKCIDYQDALVNVRLILWYTWINIGDIIQDTFVSLHIQGMIIPEASGREERRSLLGRTIRIFARQACSDWQQLKYRMQTASAGMRRRFSGKEQFQKQIWLEVNNMPENCESFEFVNEDMWPVASLIKLSYSRKPAILPSIRKVHKITLWKHRRLAPTMDMFSK